MKNPLIKKILKVFGLIVLVIVAYFYLGFSAKPEGMQWGVTFSKNYAESLGLDWQETYLAILDDLSVDNLRLAAYWNQIEPESGNFDFSVIDFQVQEAAKRDVDVLLAVGRRLPRWPECHVPEWAKELEADQQQGALLHYVEAVIKRYKDYPNIVMWQVENEFFLRNFGDCPKADSKLLDAELALVRSLDDRPIVVTDSGELGGWVGSMRRGDIFGTTMYRTVYNDMIGYATYPLRPIYYKRRFLLYKPFFRTKEIINVELQAEPWARTSLTQDSLQTQYISLNPESFRKNISYAMASGISPAYLWGAEWWYYMKVKQGVNEFWDIAKELWVQNETR